MNKIFIRHEYGQLGNILFRLANTLGFALEHGYRVEDYTLAFCNYHDGSSNVRFFEKYHPFHFFEYPRSSFQIINRIKWKFRNRGLRKTELVENFDPTFYLSSLEKIGSIELKGFHFSSEDLVIKHREKILNILEFRRDHIAPTHDRLIETRRRSQILLGVHIRHNDFKDFYSGKYFVPTADFLYGIQRVKELVPDPQQVAVVLCSDDQTVLSDIQANNPDYILPRGNIAQDMYALSQCDYLIGPKATSMSTWAAYYGNNQLFQISQNRNIETIDDFRKIKRLEPFSPN